MKRLPVSKTSLRNDMKNIRQMARRAEQCAIRGDWESFMDEVFDIESIASASRCAAEENVGAA